MEAIQLKIGFIGAGKVGVSLGKYFSLNNIKITGYYSRTYQSTLEACNFVKTIPYKNLEKLIINSDTIFITTPDDTIFKVWQNIKKFNLKHKIICHTSGSLSSEIFSNINNSGAFGYSIHPMFPFSDKFNTYKSLKNIYFSIEGNKKYLNFLKKTLENLGNKVIFVENNKKSLYHLANVVSSNLVLSLLNISCNYLEECGINKEDSIKALYPLIENNIINLKNKGFINALTGPIERNDIGTIEHHLKIIPKEHELLYKTLSLNLLKLSEEKHKERNYKKLKEYLGGIQK